MLCQFLLYSKVTQSYIYSMYIYIPFLILSSIMFYNQDIGHSSLCYTAGPHCPSILNVIVCIYLTPNSQSAPPSSPSPLATPSLFVHLLDCGMFKYRDLSLAPIPWRTPYSWEHRTYVEPGDLTGSTMMLSK